MWCGECYISDQEILFHVKQRESFDDRQKSDPDQEQLKRAWGNKQRPPNEYLVGRDGDHLLVPFECDLCIFRKLRNHEPSKYSDMDKLLLAAIRRMSLDAFWSRASSTVSANRDKIRQGLALSHLVGLEGPYIHYGTMPTVDLFGYEVAIQTVLALRRPGKHSSSHTQYESVGKYRTAYSNYVRASPQANFDPVTLGDDRGKLQRIVKDGCSSYWYSRLS
jgi:hypothetical protein